MAGPIKWLLAARPLPKWLPERPALSTWLGGLVLTRWVVSQMFWPTQPIGWQWTGAAVRAAHTFAVLTVLLLWMRRGASWAYPVRNRPRLDGAMLYLATPAIVFGAATSVDGRFYDWWLQSLPLAAPLAARMTGLFWVHLTGFPIQAVNAAEARHTAGPGQPPGEEPTNGSDTPPTEPSIRELRRPAPDHLTKSEARLYRFDQALVTLPRSGMTLATWTVALAVLIMGGCKGPSAYFGAGLLAAGGGLGLAFLTTRQRWFDWRAERVRTAAFIVPTAVVLAYGSAALQNPMECGDVFGGLGVAVGYIITIPVVAVMALVVMAELAGGGWRDSWLGGLAAPLALAGIGGWMIYQAWQIQAGLS